MIILLDAMGGDNAPDANIKGAVAAINQIKAELWLIGKEEVIKAKLKEFYKKTAEEISPRLKISRPTTNVLSSNFLFMKALIADEIGSNAIMKYLEITGNSVNAHEAWIPNVKIAATLYFARIPKIIPRMNPNTWDSAKIPILSFNAAASKRLFNAGIFFKTQSIGNMKIEVNPILCVHVTPGIP